MLLQSGGRKASVETFKIVILYIIKFNLHYATVGAFHNHEYLAKYLKPQTIICKIFNFLKVMVLWYGTYGMCTILCTHTVIIYTYVPYYLVY